MMCYRYPPVVANTSWSIPTVDKHRPACGEWKAIEQPEDCEGQYYETDSKRTALMIASKQSFDSSLHKLMLFDIGFNKGWEAAKEYFNERK